MVALLGRYARWLHLCWPAGTVEKLPRVNEDGSTNVPGLWVVGDLTGIPLLKLSVDGGARAVRTIAAEGSLRRERSGARSDGEVADLAIVGGGVSGFSAALEARRLGLDFRLLEATEPFSTIVNFPARKPIYTYPRDMEPAGELRVSADVKEGLVDELRSQTVEAGIEPLRARAEHVERRGGLLAVVLAGGGELLARRVIVAIGRSGSFRKLGVPGEDLGKVFNRLHDPKDFAGRDVLVVGGGDSALETAIALAQCGARVTLSYRGAELSRPKPENVERLEALRLDPGADVGVEEPSSERVTTSSGRFLGAGRRPGSIRLVLPSRVEEIRGDAVVLAAGEGRETVPNDVVFTMIGREPPLDLFRSSGVRIRGETTGIEWLWIALFFLAIWAFYDWKDDGFFAKNVDALARPGTFPNDAPAAVASLGEWWREQVEDRGTVIGTLAVSMKSRSFYYTLLYTLAIGVFGVLRVRRRRTPYVRLQTATLFAIQFVPLFLLPELVLPWMGYHGWFDGGLGRTVADALFEPYVSEQALAAHEWPEWGHPRAYWRAYGFILAWPLMVYNVFTSEPIAAWLAISLVQTFVLIPLIVWRWGKGAYCGWICSCGGLAETLGDTQRYKMPHGPGWNRLNLVGQGLLGLAFALLAARAVGWMLPGSALDEGFMLLVEGRSAGGETVNPFAWKWMVDVLLAGVLGVGLYFKYSGRVWCRFACPLAALMHVYARFSQFRILAEKQKCISCNVCTSVCHQGIDVMSFANKGLPMEDPECVRCSACVQGCPTGVLSFGRVDRRTGEELGRDRLVASLVRTRERGGGRIDDPGPSRPRAAVRPTRGSATRAG